MDDAFGNLGDISDEQTLERLESLFESSGNFGSLESPMLNEDVSGGSGSLFGPLEGNSEIFSASYGTPSATPVSVASSSVPVSASVVESSNGPGSVSSSCSYTQPSTPATPQAAPSSSPSISPRIKSSPSPAPQQQQPQVLYATKSTAVRINPSISTSQQVTQQQQSNLIFTAPSAVLTGGSQLMQTAGGTLQIQLTPSALRKPPQQQPQLLPKPLTKITVPTSSSANNTLTGIRTSSSILLNQSGQILTTSVAQNQPLLINSLGQVVSAGMGHGTAVSNAGGTPFLISQQPSGNQVLLLRPPAPPSQPTGGTFLFQQPSGGGPNTAVITAQPQVKIITPQGRMQMQQIQTPSGPKLIAVPVGQTLVQTSAGLISTSAGNVLAGISPTINIPQQVSSQPLVNHHHQHHAPPILSAPQSPAAAAAKKKKTKKRSKDTDPVSAAALSSCTPSKKPKVVDLGELMKDVGLDLEGFHEDDEGSSGNTGVHSAGSSSCSSGGVLTKTSSSETPSASVVHPGSQLVAQIQQPLPIQGNPNQLQLVQGPDGQFVLQSTIQQPTILTQAVNSLDGSTLSIPSAAGSATPTIINTANLNITPSSLSGSLIGATSLAALPQRTAVFSSAAGPTLVNSSFINSRPTVSVISTVPNNINTISTSSSSSHSNPTTIGSSVSIPTATAAGLNHNNNNNTIIHKSAPVRHRGGSNRIPLYEDDRLPPGWYRKVSQRKSGASAGRFEVFIVGPTGKRFRSRNELKSFFEQTGECNLDPEDFDFSTFGSGRHGTLVKAPENHSSPVVLSGAPPTLQSSQAQPSPMAPTISHTHSSSNNNISNNSVSVNNSSSSNHLLVSKGSGGPEDSPLPTLEPNPSSSSVILQQQQPDHTLSTSAPSLLPSVLPPSSKQQPAFSSQISRETEDADAQISQLLKTLQEEPHKLSIDPEFIQSLAGGDVDFDGSLTPPPPTLAPAVTSKAETTHLKTHNVPEQQLNNTTANNSSSSNRLPSESPGNIKLKTFINPVVNSSSPLIGALPQQQQQPQQQIIQVSRELVAGMGAGNPGMTSVPIGGVSTQVRALQNLPSNTRLFRGPNGQYTIQKVQTIELSPEMQQSLKEVQSRIHEIEKQMAKSPQDEAELATLQTRQQRILAMGRPIPTSANTILGNTPLPPPSSSIGMINPGATLSTSSVPQIHDKGGAPSSSNAAATAGLVTASKSLPPEGMITTPSGTNIPPLTEAQKRIVAQFKQKMASLPPEQQAQFIAANKASLIRKLNFQPSQIHILCSNRIATRAPSLTPEVPPPPTAAAAIAAARRSNNNVFTPAAAAVPSPVSSTPPSLVPETRPAPPPPPPSINKHKKIAWVESQVKKDQNEAVHPNIKAPFRSKEDACKRLLRYHVFHELNPHPEKVIEEEMAFSARSEEILGKFNAMRDKYHLLLLQESMRLTTSSEEVMLARLWDSDERSFLGKQKGDFEKTGIPLGHLPPIPPSWREKYIQVLGHPPPPPPPPREEIGEKCRRGKVNPPVGGGGGRQAEEDYDEFHSIQSELRRYNSINGIGNNSGSSELFELPPQKIRSPLSDEEEDFGLKDVCGGNGVDAILGGDGGSFGQKGGEDVQSAINSILDDDRVQTPDINNIAGLLDSFSDATSDPATESAVNSIPRF